MTVNAEGSSKKTGADEPICNAERETDIEKKRIDTKGR